MVHDPRQEADQRQPARPTLITPDTLYTARVEGERAKTRPAHTLINTVYEQLDTTITHPATLNPAHDGWICLTIQLTLNRRWAANWPTTTTVQLDIPPKLKHELLHDPDRWTPPTQPELTRPASWPDYPRLHLAAPGRTGRGGTLLGWIEHGDRPRGGGIRIKRTGGDDDLVYPDLDTAIRYGWQIRQAH